MKVRQAAIVLGLLSLAGCQYRAKPEELVGEYIRPNTNETLTIKADGTAIVRNLPGHPGEVRLYWSRFPDNDDTTCTWVNFETKPLSDVEWHTCANKIVGRDTVFVGYPYGDPDDTFDFEKINPTQG